MRHAEFRGSPNIATVHRGPLAVGASAVTLLSLTGPLNAKTEFVLVAVETNPIRMTLTGQDPTTTSGVNLPVDTVVILSRAEADLARVIRVTSDAALQALEYLS